MNRCIQVGQKWFPNLNLWPDLILTFVCMYLSLFESVKRKTETHDYRTLKCTLVTFQPGSSPFFSFPFNFLKFFSWCGSYYIYNKKIMITYWPRLYDNLRESEKSRNASANIERLLIRRSVHKHKLNISKITSRSHARARERERWENASEGMIWA